jgi:hypothetical protein
VKKSAKQIVNAISAAVSQLFPAQTKADKGQNPSSQKQAVASAPAAMSTPPGAQSQGVTQGTSNKADDKDDDNCAPAPNKHALGPQVLMKYERPFPKQLITQCERNVNNQNITHTDSTGNTEIHVIRTELITKQVRAQLENTIIAARNTTKDVAGDQLTTRERQNSRDWTNQTNLANRKAQGQGATQKGPTPPAKAVCTLASSAPNNYRYPWALSHRYSRTPEQ